MATEAQMLIGISLAKIAQSRMNRGGISLHKNLLVATVLQKARYIFMEEAYGVAFVQAASSPATAPEIDVSTDKEKSLHQETGPENTRRPSKRRRESVAPSSELPSAPKSVCNGLASQPTVAEEPALIHCANSSERTVSESPSDNEPMEVDCITSLVSVFSFSANSDRDSLEVCRLNRSFSTPDMCSAQAKELDGLQQRATFPMTVR